MSRYQLVLSAGRCHRPSRQWFLFRRLVVYTVLFVLFVNSPIFRHPSIQGGSEKAESEASQLKHAAASPKILLVTALFPLEQSKHSPDDYDAWLSNFLGPQGVDCDIYFYTTPSLQPLVESLHESASNHTGTLIVNTTFTSPFDIPPLAPYKAKYEQMHGWDRERDIHNPELYAVWNAKPWLLHQALESMSVNSAMDHDYEYDYAFWNDAGSFRDRHAFGAWPDPNRVNEVFKMASKETGQPRHELVFFPLLKLPSEREFGNWDMEKGPVDMDFSEGSFFGATPNAIAWFANTYYAYHNHFISTAPLQSVDESKDHGRHPHAPPQEEVLSAAPSIPFHFVGKDQTLINSLLFLYPSRFFGVVNPLRINDLPIDPHSPLSSIPLLPSSFRRWLGPILVRKKMRLGEQCIDEWFYYQWWFAGRTERRGTEVKRGWKRWSDYGSGMSWLNWLRLVGRVFADSETCGEETQLVSVSELLEGVFGAKWIERVQVGRISVES